MNSNILTIPLCGRIDSTNADSIAEMIEQARMVRYSMIEESEKYAARYKEYLIKHISEEFGKLRLKRCIWPVQIKK